MTVRTDLDSAWAWWNQSTLLVKWRRDNPGEWAALDAYRKGGSRPVLLTAVGKALVAETDAWRSSGTPAVSPPVGPFMQRSSSLFLRTAGDALTEKIEVTSSPDYGIGNMVWPSQPSTGTWTLRDCVVRNVAASPPRVMDGTGEAGFWIGQRTKASRLKASGCAWMGMWTGAACEGSVIEDFDLSGNPHVGLYVEHVTANTVFRRFKIDHRGGDASAVNVEWWYGGKGSHDLVFEDFDITVDAGKWAFYLDAGTYGVTIRNGVIRGSGNGITHPRNLADPAKPNRIDWASIQFLASGTRETVHGNVIG